MKKLLVFCCAFAFASLAFADEVPIEDLSPNIAAPVQQSLSLDQRIQRLEQQQKNLTQMNLAGKIDDLEQQVQQLQGQLEVQSHDLKLLNEQLRNFYQDLEQRIQQAKNLSGSSSSDNNPIAKLPDATKKQAQTLLDKDETSYKAAFNLLVAKKYDPAVTKLQAYLKNYPNGKYVANVHYWLGEIYYLKSKFTDAATEFTTVVTTFPTSNKVSDAKYKLAMILLVQGKTAAAKKAFMDIQKSYPKSSAARLATQQLQKL